MRLSQNVVETLGAIGLESETYSDDQLRECVVKKAHKQKPIPAGWDGRWYAITTLAKNKRCGGTRTVAICATFERAREIVEKNEGDIWELSYNLVVIEAVLPDALYGGSPSDETYWYRWERKARRYNPIETPPGFEQSFGFGIG